MKTISKFTLLLSVLAFNLYGSDLQITNVRVLDRADIANNPLSVLFDVQWDNAWNTDKNHDGIWIFMKFNSRWNNHVKLVPGSQQILQDRIDNGNPSFEFSPDSLGFFLVPPAGHRGGVNYKLQIAINPTQNIARPRLRGLKVHGIEMAYIPSGPFTVGSPDTSATKRAAFYASDASGNPGGLFTITSEDEIAVLPTPGNFYYWSENPLYNGDQQGPIPAAFPKGHDAYYLMKYELTQGQYADFLNDLPDSWASLRSPIGGREYLKKRGSLRLIDGRYVAESPSRPMNQISFTDGLAYSDWAALRPITELEYEKAARGPSDPIEGEFVWGTNNYSALERYVDDHHELVFSNTLDEKDLNDANRAKFGASYYWVMDLSGSVWEKVITVGNAIGRSFTGSHGDGRLHFGHADNSDWPTSDDEVGGFGYRGGGYYEPGTQYSDFNPHSPIGYRYYGAWSGGPRSIAYGYRAGRSAPN